MFLDMQAALDCVDGWAGLGLAGVGWLSWARPDRPGMGEAGCWQGYHVG